MPARCGVSYPANAGWRCHALAALGRADVVVRDLRERWATNPAVIENCALAEDWVPLPDSQSQWSHCPVQIFNVVLQDLIGLRASAPGFTSWTLRPQLADIGNLDADLHTVGGCFRVRITRDGHGRRMVVEVPAGVGSGTLILPNGERRTVAPGTSLTVCC